MRTIALMSVLGHASTALSRMREKGHNGRSDSPTLQFTETSELSTGTPARRENHSPGRLRLALAGLSTFLALIGVAAAGRSHRKLRTAQRVEQAPTQIFDEFGRLTQELAHEIRNPLTAINARLYKLQKRLPAGTPEHRDAVIIENEIKRLDQMLENFRKLGCAIQPQLERVKGETLVQEVCELLTAELEPRNVHLRWEVQPGLELRADPQQLKQVLINLIKNAGESILAAGQRHAPACKNEQGPNMASVRGTVWVRMRRGRAELHGQSTPAIIFEVEDDGPGIPAHVRTRMFEPFFSTKQHGTGLGLPLAARIIGQHGGALEFVSNRGQGSKFRVLLPEERS
jgi:signal transduction histidine kinase